MIRLSRTIRDFAGQRKAIRAGRYGVIETHAGVLVAIHLRAWPKVLSLRELWPVGDRFHEAGPADRCRLYYNQPRSAPGFLALRYVASTRGAGYRTIRTALLALDWVAELKQTDAIVCDAANSRLSDRSLRRMGWAPHKPQRWRRNYIRRFYGEYPPNPLSRSVEPSASADGVLPVGPNASAALREPLWVG
ncbi:hypothetical protein Pla175_14390 [Pirellulimonas nuda]|uniref:N-acetyltransferase domain-containing protein n=1 Tax=Pirellulimonas nuda TaxID=2528009 RepID=A0A518D9B5_9BACT|nr:hypothetical protein [Pirellulimonas nuda]QDU88069.1 hypothetical protein Pla175_14390 [Pirellulimonas nuda]